MNCKRICFLIIAIFFSYLNINAQNTNYFESSKFDSILKVCDLAKHDFWFPNELLETDIHRLSIIDSLLNKPLNSFNVINNLTEDLFNFVNDGNENYSTKVLHYLNLPNYKFSSIDTKFPGKRLNEELNIQIDNGDNIMTNLVAKEYISLFLQTYWLAVKENSKIPSKDYEFIIRNLDLVFFENSYTNGTFFDNYRRMKSSKKIAKEFFSRAKFFDKYEMCGLGFSVLKTLLNINEKFLKPEFDLKEIKSTVYNTKYGRIAIGGIEDNTYEGDYLMIIDFGGNDKYIFPDRNKFSSISNPVQIIVDFSGNDTYEGGDFNIAGGIMGVNLLLDYSGNDTYRARNFGLGSSFFGFSSLIDFAGDDIYTGGKYSQGASAFGVGMLIDKSGNDIYNCLGFSQGFGYVRGLGVLADINGNDSYIAKGYAIDALRHEDKLITWSQGAATGYRPYASGGIGILADKSGDDKYISDVFGQGVGFWYGLGSLVDKAGRDSYSAYQYAQGAGVHKAIGVLIDESGDDVYISNGVSQGSGHDLAFGALHDQSGNDKYLCESLSLGGGNANGISIFCDENGDDSYSAKNPSNCFGFSDYRRYFGSPALFIDGSGNDTYSGKDYNGEFNYKSTFGYFIDELDSSKTTIISSAEVNIQLRGKNIEELYMEASAESLEDQKYVIPAVHKLASFKEKALEYLYDQMDTDLPREILTIENTFQEVNLQSPQALKDILNKCLNSKNTNKIIFALRTITSLKINSFESELGTYIKDSNPNIRQSAITAIAELRATEYDSLLNITAKDSSVLVRAKTAMAFAKIMPEDLYLKIEPILLDSMKVVRDNFFSNLNPESENYLKFIFSVYDPGMSIEAQAVFSKYIGKIVLPKTEYKKFRSLINKQAQEVRYQIYKSIKESDLDFWKNSLKDVIRSEKNQEMKLYFLNNE